MSIVEQVVIHADDGQVLVTILHVGRLEMQPESAVTLAFRLLDAANEIQPGIGGHVYPPRLEEG